jgi:hypothetical protein
MKNYKNVKEKREGTRCLLNPKYDTGATKY